MTTPNESLSTAALAKSVLSLQLLTLPNRFETAPGNVMTACPEYLVDAFQRSVLFLDLLRQRGNEEIEITSRPMATVVSFGHEVLMDGRSLPRPMNYTLSRIVAPSGIEIDPRKRPVIVVDPRAGQGPGVGGFKAESEIGDALNAGHPVYFTQPIRGVQNIEVQDLAGSPMSHWQGVHGKNPMRYTGGLFGGSWLTAMASDLGKGKIDGTAFRFRGDA